MDEHEIHSQKAAIRATIRANRLALSEAEKSAAAQSLTQHMIDLVTARGARTVTCYLPVRSEPDTTMFLAWARENGVRVLLPACRADMLLDWIEPEGDDTIIGAMGIPEPVGKVLSPIEFDNSDLVFLPAAAVGEDGMRLGWGGGYYDRTLGSTEQVPDTFALLYDDELLPEVPREEHDIAITGVVQPRGVRYLDRAPLASEEQ